MSDRPNSPADVGYRPEHADSLKPRSRDVVGETHTSRPSTGTSYYGGRSGLRPDSPALPDACEWCGWLAPLLVLLEVTWRSSKRIRNREHDVKRVESWWLCRLCREKAP